MGRSVENIKGGEGEEGGGSLEMNVGKDRDENEDKQWDGEKVMSLGFESKVFRNW